MALINVVKFPEDTGRAYTYHYEICMTSWRLWPGTYSVHIDGVGRILYDRVGNQAICGSRRAAEKLGVQGCPDSMEWIRQRGLTVQDVYRVYGRDGEWVHVELLGRLKNHVVERRNTFPDSLVIIVTTFHMAKNSSRDVVKFLVRERWISEVDGEESCRTESYMMYDRASHSLVGEYSMETPVLLGWSVLDCGVVER